MKLVKPVTLTKAVAVPGTAVPLSTYDLWVLGAEITAKRATTVNTGAVYLGDSTVNRTTNQGQNMLAGDVWQLPIPADCETNLANWYVDADTAADGVVITALIRGK